MNIINTSSIRFFDEHPPQQDIRSEVFLGLNQSQKTLPAKYFYDQRGSMLFDLITHLPEYYITRTEISLLRRYQDEIQELVGEDSILIEYGSGASVKIRMLLNSLKPRLYIPMDISKDFLLCSADKLVTDYPWLNVYAGCVDYSQPIALPADIHIEGKKLAFFPGSSLGNFHPNEALSFLRQVHSTLGKDGSLLIGIDLQKNSQVLEAAYNDQQNITSAFNKNILLHLNRMLAANFDVNRFQHKAIYNQKIGRIEMHLISKVDQIVTIDCQQVGFKQGESIHTENSYKYTLEGFSQLAEKAGFKVKQHWSDQHKFFSLFFLSKS